MSDTAPAALEAARSHRDDIVTFLREMIAIPAESLQEGERCERILAEYRKLGFDDAWFDDLGNVVVRVGDGPLKILMVRGNSIRSKASSKTARSMDGARWTSCRRSRAWRTD